jgi:hypothetical protein
MFKIKMNDNVIEMELKRKRTEYELKELEEEYKYLTSIS